LSARSLADISARLTFVLDACPVCEKIAAHSANTGSRRFIG
jgi:hypothetical protein